MFRFYKTYQTDIDLDIVAFESAFTEFITPKKDQNGETIPFEITGALDTKKRKFNFTDVSQAAYLYGIECDGTYKKRGEFLSLKLSYNQVNYNIILYAIIGVTIAFLIPEFALFSLLIIPIYLYQYLIFRIQTKMSYQIHLEIIERICKGDLMSDFDNELIS